MNVPEDLRYTKNHEWVRVDDTGMVSVGVTDFAQDALGDVVYVDLPDLDRSVGAGESFAEIESTKSVNDVYAPVAGTVVAVNDALMDTPELVNADPYGDGWYMIMKTPEFTIIKISRISAIFSIVSTLELCSNRERGWTFYYYYHKTR